MWFVFNGGWTVAFLPICCEVASLNDQAPLAMLSPPNRVSKVPHMASLFVSKKYSSYALGMRQNGLHFTVLVFTLTRSTIRHGIVHELATGKSEVKQKWLVNRYVKLSLHRYRPVKVDDVQAPPETLRFTHWSTDKVQGDNCATVSPRLCRARQAMIVTLRPLASSALLNDRRVSPDASTAGPPAHCAGASVRLCY